MKFKVSVLNFLFPIMMLCACCHALEAFIPENGKKCAEECIALSDEETKVLESFFNALIQQSEGGYVLYGKKPVCITGFQALDLFGGASQSHKESVCLKEGSALWRKISTGRRSNIIIHIYNRPEMNWFHVLMIDKKLFRDTVQKNLPLFQYVLGPQVTPAALLAKLTDPNETFHHVLKEDKVLIGILLGFGVQNALHVARIENLQDGYLSAGERFPMKGQYNAIENLLGCYKDIYLNRLEKETENVELKPSFSYLSLEDEIADATTKIEVSSEKLARVRPWFIFGRLKHDKETDKLVEELEKTQDEIVKLNASAHFLQDVCKMIYPEIKLVVDNAATQENVLFSLEQSEAVAKVVSKNIWQSICNQNQSYMQGVFLGMQAAQNDTRSPLPSISYDYTKLKVVKAAKENVDNADRVFALLDHDQQFTPLENKHVYYRVLQQGDGQQLTGPQQVTVHCKATTPSGDVLVDTWNSGKPIEVDLNETLSGFAIGMTKMQERERREIYIHPSLAYGLYTNLEKGIYLKAEVELVEIGPQKEASGDFRANYFDFSPFFDRLKQFDFDAISRDEGYLLGYEVWSHYKKLGFLSLSKVVDMIKQYDRTSNHAGDRPLPEEGSEEEQDLLNHVHWHLYMRDGGA